LLPCFIKRFIELKEQRPSSNIQRQFAEKKGGKKGVRAESCTKKFFCVIVEEKFT
jgi:hypothetical protein